MRQAWTSAATAALAGVLAFGLASPARALPTTFSGSLSVVIGTLPPIVVNAEVAADVTLSGPTFSSLTLAGGSFATTLTIPVTDPAAAPITQVVGQNVMNGAGLFDLTNTGTINNNFATNLTGQGSGAMGVSGVAKVGLFPGPLANLSVPLTSGGVNGVGLGGNIVTASAFGTGVSVRGAPWTAGTAQIGSLTAMGFVTGTGIQLVTPIFISTTVGGSAVIPAFGVLTLALVPEPGTLLLLSSGAAALALLGRRRARS